MKKYTLIATASFPGAESKSASLTLLPNFELKIKPLKEKNTFVPLGIPDFKGNTENKLIEFEIEILKHGIDEFSVEILHNDEVIYTAYFSKQVLDEVSITAKGTNTKKENQKKKEEEVSMNYPIGKFHFIWDGFDSNGIYDSTLFTSGKLKARVKGKISSVEKIAESEEFSFEYKEVKWVDTKIDKNIKRIDVTLRVNLKDGGARGIDCEEVVHKDYLNPGMQTTRRVCPWDKIPKEALSFYQKEPLKSKTQNFEKLQDLVLDGINIYWSRRYTNTKGTIINSENWEIVVTAINTENSEISLDDIPLIYNTNNSWYRSGNTGGSYNDGNLDDEVMGLLPNGIVQRISFNSGYIYHSNWKEWYKSHPIHKTKGWIFNLESKE